MQRNPQATVQGYLKRNPWARACDAVLPEPLPGLKLAVVIPSLAETESLPEVLDSLVANRRLAETEILVLVNQSENASVSVHENNQRTLQLKHRYARHPVPVHFLDAASPGLALPAAHAGVGLARRFGLDAGLERLAQTGHVDRAALACLDADSPVAPGYMDAILEIFDVRDQPVAGYCSYQHPEPKDPALRPAMAAYELWLRYLVAGLRVAGSLFAFPTIGSCTVVSAAAYAQVGGMEPRQAAEDFHFLRKLAKLSGERPLAHITQARVFPAARVSDRVPFGTGRAMQRSQEEGAGTYLQVEPPEVFFELAEFFKRLPEAFADLNVLRALPGRLLAFLESENAWPVLEKFQAVYPGPHQFALAAQHWFDSLRCVRYANEAARNQGKVWAFGAWQAVLARLGLAEALADLKIPSEGNAEPELQMQWLEKIRALEM